MTRRSIEGGPRLLWICQIAMLTATVTLAFFAKWNIVAALSAAPAERAKPASVAYAPQENPPRLHPPIPEPSPAKAETPPERDTATPEKHTAKTQPAGAPDSDPAPAGTAPERDTNPAIPLSAKLQTHLRTLCADYAVPMPLVLAIIEVESDFQPDCVSSTHDYGLMQVNRCNFADCRARFGEVDFLDPVDNLTCGVWLFATEYHAEDGNAVRALMRYNNGPTGARRKWANGIYETAYTRKVVAAMEKWEEIWKT